MLAAGCGGGEASPDSVVRAWNQAVLAEDNEAAAELFAPGARIVQAGQAFTLETTADAYRFNAGLPCAAEIVAIEEQGETVTATFVLSDRETSRCDGPGAEVTVIFEIRDGKIVLWQQLPQEGPPPGESV
jgi:hypothetical protein